MSPHPAIGRFLPFWTAFLIAALLLPSGVSLFAKKKEFPIELEKMSGRQGKLLFKATWGWGGRLGTFHDVDADGQLEFIALDRKKGNVSLRLIQIDSEGPAFDVAAGKGNGAGLAAVNLDDDAAMEFVVAYGDKLSALEAGLVGALNGLLATFVGVPIVEAGNTTWVVTPVLRPDRMVDLHDIVAFDDDGSRLWHRDLKAEKAAGEPWKETRFQWIVQHADRFDATIIITDDARQELIGLSAQDGSIRWTRSLVGKTPSSRRGFSALIDQERLLPVLFSPDNVLILDPDTGSPVFDGTVERGVAQLPSWHVFSEGRQKSYLVFGENRTEIRMVGLDSGSTLWSASASDKVLEIVPLPDGERFIMVSNDGIQLMNTGGETLARYTAPEKIKTKFPPVYRDLNDDGEMELIFVSGKKFICWQPATNELLWEASMFGIVGGANPVQLYDSFHDIDQDGWLDVPGSKGGGTGRWLSGKTGAVLSEVGNGSAPPIVGDWDRDGQAEVFWFNTWYEVPVVN